MGINNETLRLVFEQYMFAFYQEHQRFSLNDFGDFATTLLNHYVNTQALPLSEKLEAAHYLTQLYNKGIGNRIAEADVTKIAEVIAKDYTFDTQLLQRILR